MYLYSLCAVVAIAAGVQALPKCTTGGYQLIPKEDCVGYFLCVFGRPVEMPDCPSGSVFSTAGHVCVPKGSIYDDCKAETKPAPLPDRPTLPDSGKYSKN